MITWFGSYIYTNFNADLIQIEFLEITVNELKIVYMAKTMINSIEDK